MSRWEVYRALIPDNLDLVSSRNTPGSVRGFFLGDDGILGHAEFSKIDLRKVAAVAVPVLVAAGFAGGIAAAPRVRRWWNDQARPAARAGWRRVTRQREHVAPDGRITAGLAFSQQVDVALEGASMSMSSAQAQQYLLEIMMAAAIIADRMRALSHAHINDDAELSDLTIAMDKLTTGEVTNIINRMLATGHAMRNEETVELFARIFAGGHVADGEYVPLTVDKVQKVLSLDAGEDRATAQVPTQVSTQAD